MKKWLLPVVVSLFLTTGCSSTFVYNNLDWLVYWYIDDYIELSDSQESIFDRYLAGWIQWHRNVELQKYSEQLALVREDIRRGRLSEERMVFHLKQAEEHWDRVRSELSPELAELATTLTDEQIVELFAALEKENQQEQEEYDEYLAMDEDEQKSDRIDRITSSIEDRIGRLNDEQKAIITRYSPLFMSTRAQWIAYRRAIQASARQLFANRANNPDFQTDLQALLENPDNYRSDAYRLQREENQQVYARMAAEIAATLSVKQKDKLIDEIDGLIDDLQTLYQR